MMRAVYNGSRAIVAKRVYGLIAVINLSRFWYYRGQRLFAFTVLSGSPANRSNGTERVVRNKDKKYMEDFNLLQKAICTEQIFSRYSAANFKKIL